MTWQAWDFDLTWNLRPSAVGRLRLQRLPRAVSFLEITARHKNGWFRCSKPCTIKLQLEKYGKKFRLNLKYELKTFECDQSNPKQKILSLIGETFEPSWEIPMWAMFFFYMFIQKLPSQGFIVWLYIWIKRRILWNMLDCQKKNQFLKGMLHLCQTLFIFGICEKINVCVSI